VAAALTLAGQLIVGAVSSATVTENVQEAVLPAASRVSHSTWVTPTANWLPDAALQLMG
jgi:hypothetical protein